MAREDERARINELLQDRANLINEMRELNDLAESENRDLTAEEAEKYAKLEADATELGSRARRLEQLHGFTRPPDGRPLENLEERDEDRGNLPATLTLASPEYRTAYFDGFMRQRMEFAAEYRVLSKATPAAGAYAVPTTYMAELLEALRDRSPMRTLCRIISTAAGEQITMPSVTAHGTATWIAENAAFTPSDETFGTFTINAFKAGTLMLVSEELLTDASFNLESYIREEFAQRIGVLQDTAYLTGDGTGKPAGLLPAATTVAAGAATAITFTDVMNLIYGITPQYRRLGGTFMLNDATIGLLRAIKDDQGQYLWSPSMTAGAPDTIWGYPVVSNPDMPLVATGLRSVLFGNFNRAYIIRDVDGIYFQRLQELYAVNGQVGFRAYHRTDGRVRDANAVKALLHP